MIELLPIVMGVLSASAQTVPIRLADVPAEYRQQFPRDFDGYIAELERESARRLTEGEWDHLIYYLLQSRRFTNRPPIEPALSSGMPADVAARIDDFLRAPIVGERMRYLRSLAKGDREAIVANYERSMRFLKEKEFESRKRQGDSRRQFVSSLYQSRGHSSDTSLDPSFTIHVGLQALHEMRPSLRVKRVLVIGPGLDFAPRTALAEEHPPQSYQPFVLADSLLRLGMSATDSLEVRCADLNPRVVDYFETFLKNPVLHLRWQPEDEEQRSFFSGISAAVAKRRVPATLLNVITGHLANEKFDLIVATNLLLYFNEKELLLALANIQAMLNTGAAFLHNDVRAEIEEYSIALGMPPIHARMIRLSQKRQLYDSVVIHIR